jgi:hypothetical protein
MYASQNVNRSEITEQRDGLTGRIKEADLDSLPAICILRLIPDLNPMTKELNDHEEILADCKQLFSQNKK